MEFKIEAHMDTLFRSEHDIEFYANCAIAAMQGIQESGMKIEGFAAMLMPGRLAEVAFNMADAMLNEYQKRLAGTDSDNNNK